MVDEVISDIVCHQKNTFEVILTVNFAPKQS